MATGAGNRNGVHKAQNLRASSSFKSKVPQSTVRRSSSSVGAAADSGGLPRLVVYLPFIDLRDLITFALVKDTLLLDHFCWRLHLISASFEM